MERCAKDNGEGVRRSTQLEPLRRCLAARREGYSSGIYLADQRALPSDLYQKRVDRRLKILPIRSRCANICA
jgi:hypothetical protein